MNSENPGNHENHRKQRNHGNRGNPRNKNIVVIPRNSYENILLFSNEVMGMEIWNEVS